jgi:hypothetical protein
MMKSMMTEDPWKEIEARNAALIGRRVEGHHRLSIYWARSDDGSPGLLIREIDLAAIPRSVPRLRGVNIHVGRSDAAPAFVKLTLQGQESREVFLALCLDVICSSALEETVAAATSRVFTRIAQWHALLSRDRSLDMSPPEIRGLIGELCVLERLAASVGHAAAVRAWVAPDNHPQDFALAAFVVEVKTRISGSRSQVEISSLEQLESGSLPIALVVVELLPSEDAVAFSLNDLVDRLVGSLPQLDSSVENVLLMSLASRGYIKRDAYGVERYLVAQFRAFEVLENFPKLTRAATAPAIRQARYSLDLTAIAPFETPVSTVLGELR